MIRLTGGEFRGRSIETPASQRTRPTQSKLRQALFNSIQAWIPGAHVLDLYAGSGSLGFEALSRGAAQVVFVEEAKPVLKIIEKNVLTLGVRDRVRIMGASVQAQLWDRIRSFGPFDIVLADPPYDPFASDQGGCRTELLEGAPWNELLAPDGVFCLEWCESKKLPEGLPDRFPFLVKTREKNYGDSVLTTFSRVSETGETA